MRCCGRKPRPEVWLWLFPSSTSPGTTAPRIPHFVLPTSVLLALFPPTRRRVYTQHEHIMPNPSYTCFHVNTSNCAHKHCTLVGSPLLPPCPALPENALESRRQESPWTHKQMLFMLFVTFKDIRIYILKTRGGGSLVV